MKKLICLLLAVTLVFTLCACGKKDVVDNKDGELDDEITDVVSADDNETNEPETESSTENRVNIYEVGFYITYGSYEQDNDTSNGKEDIEWLVLDVQDGKALVISKNIIDCKSYNTENAYVTWETCTLREWLNDDFFNSAFSTSEKSKIPTVTVSADANYDYETDQGNDTQDKIFLLSVNEATEYFDSDSALQCEPTGFALANGEHKMGNYCWWLRSIGSYQYCAALVQHYGFVDPSGYDVSMEIYGVRPAMWIEIG